LEYHYKLEIVTSGQILNIRVNQTVRCEYSNKLPDHGPGGEGSHGTNGLGIMLSLSLAYRLHDRQPDTSAQGVAERNRDITNVIRRIVRLHQIGKAALH